jgi:hypothetical protein
MKMIGICFGELATEHSKLPDDLFGQKVSDKVASCQFVGGLQTVEDISAP